MRWQYFKHGNKVTDILQKAIEKREGLLGEKTDSISTLKAKADAIQAEIDALPGWRFKATGTIGGSVSGFNNWYSIPFIIVFSGIRTS